VAERTEFHEGDKAPNPGIYQEYGSMSYQSQITNPQRIEMKKGDKFPKMTNEDRVWKKVKKPEAH
jgi:hypothetical protein